MDFKNIDIKLEKYFKKYSYDTNKLVGIDPTNKNFFLLKDDVLSKINDKDVKKEYLISSYIPTQYIINYEFTIAKNLLDKIELSDYVETRCYEDMDLDDSEEYVFKYKIVKEEDKNYLISVFIISHKDLKQFFEPIIDKYNYLDYITYPGFAFSALYKKQILEPHNDLFIYFGKNNIYVTLYSEGKFCQTSIIPEGLYSIYETLSSSIKVKNFDFEKFLTLIISKGLDFNNYKENEHIVFNELSELFSNKFLIISNQLNSSIRKFSLTTIDRIYMSSINGVIPGSSEFANMYLGVEANDLKFDTPYNPNNIKIDQLLFLTMLYSKVEYETKDEDNFTLFNRPPTFFYRKSGQLISVSIASLLLSIAYPLYQMSYSYILNSKNTELQQKSNQLKNQKNQFQKINNKLQNNLKNLNKEKTNIIKHINNVQSIIKKIYLEKENYIPKSIFLAKISTYFHKNKVYLKDIKYDNIKQMIVFDIYAKKAKYITNLINDIIENEHIVVSTPGYKQELGVYSAQMTIKVEK